jgi:hypothetical protein
VVDVDEGDDDKRGRLDDEEKVDGDNVGGDVDDVDEEEDGGEAVVEDKNGEDVSLMFLSLGVEYVRKEGEGMYENVIKICKSISISLIPQGK